MKNRTWPTYLLISLCALIAVAGPTYSTPLSLEELLEQGAQWAMNVQDISADLEIKELQNGRTVRTTGNLKVSQALGLLRLELYEPSVLRGQVIVADEESLEVKVFLPIADQIMVRDLESMGAEAGIQFDMDNLGSVFDFYDYDVVIQEVIEEEEGFVYVLRVTGFENQTQIVWLRQWDWIPFQIELYENDTLLGTLELTNVAVDQGYTREELTELPDVRIFRP